MNDLMPFVTVVIPVLNEERHLKACIDSLLLDTYPHDRLDFVVVDGGSIDSTIMIATAMQAQYPFIRILHNPKRVQSAAFNVAMRQSSMTDFFMRADAHAVYPANFISTAVETARQRPDDIIVYNAHAEATSCFQQAVAYAQNTRLGVGNSHYRLGERSDYVEHGFHGLFRAAHVREVDGYDENFVTNEDAELSYRLSLVGHRAWLDQRLNVGYIPRSSVSGLLRQYWRYGKGRAQNLLKHHVPPRPRQTAPLLLTVATPLCIIAGLLGFWPAWLPLAIYAFMVIVTVLIAAAAQNNLCLLWALLAFPSMHFAWGAGFLYQVITTKWERRR